MSRCLSVATNLHPSDEMISTLRNATAFCFDVDSTVITEEGIDQLADFKGVGSEVANMTAQ